MTCTFIEDAERCSRLSRAESWGGLESLGVIWSGDPSVSSPGPVYAIYPVCAYSKMNRQVKYQEASSSTHR